MLMSLSPEVGGVYVGKANYKKNKCQTFVSSIWVFPKIGVGPPNHPF